MRVGAYAPMRLPALHIRILFKYVPDTEHLKKNYG